MHTLLFSLLLLWLLVTTVWLFRRLRSGLRFPFLAFQIFALLWISLPFLYLLTGWNSPPIDEFLWCGAAASLLWYIVNWVFLDEKYKLTRYISLVGYLIVLIFLFQISERHLFVSPFVSPVLISGGFVFIISILLFLRWHTVIHLTPLEHRRKGALVAMMVMQLVLMSFSPMDETILYTRWYFDLIIIVLTIILIGYTHIQKRLYDGDSTLSIRVYLRILLSVLWTLVVSSVLLISSQNLLPIALDLQTSLIPSLFLLAVYIFFDRLLLRIEWFTPELYSGKKFRKARDELVGISHTQELQSRAIQIILDWFHLKRGEFISSDSLPSFIHEAYQRADVNILVRDEFVLRKYFDAPRRRGFLRSTPSWAFLMISLWDQDHHYGYIALSGHRAGRFFTSYELQLLENLSAFLINQFRYIDTYHALAAITEDLDGKVTEKTQEYHALISQQKEFISIISHEVRSPIGSAIFQTDSILDDIRSEKCEPHKIESELRVLYDKLISISEIISKLFTIQYFHQQKSSIFRKRVSFHHWLETRLDLFCRMHTDVEWSIQIDPTIGSVFIDAVQFEQVLNNLIQNALKFAHKKTPKIGVTALRSGDKCVLNIEDNGSWFPDGTDPSRLFDKLYRGTTSSAGLGMGLYLAKEIIELHHGKIEAGCSMRLGGASFTIEIPR